MATWYVTTGVSLRENSRCWRFADENLNGRIHCYDDLPFSELFSKNGAHDYLVQLQRERGEILAVDGDDGEKKRQIERRVAESFDPGCWHSDKFKTLPAELATLFQLCWAEDESNRLRSGDEIKLIVGNSNREVGWFLAAMLEELKTEKVAENLRLPAVKIEEMGPYAIDPVDTGAFGDGMNILWGELQDHLTDARFVLTGGYKGVLISLAGKLGTMKNVPIYYSHEQVTETVIKLCDDKAETVASNPPFSTITEY